MYIRNVPSSYQVLLTYGETYWPSFSMRISSREVRCRTITFFPVISVVFLSCCPQLDIEVWFQPICDMEGNDWIRSGPCASRTPLVPFQPTWIAISPTSSVRSSPEGWWETETSKKIASGVVATLPPFSYTWGGAAVLVHIRSTSRFPHPYSRPISSVSLTGENAARSQLVASQSACLPTTPRRNTQLARNCSWVCKTQDDATTLWLGYFNTPPPSQAGHAKAAELGKQHRR